MNWQRWRTASRSGFRQPNSAGEMHLHRGSSIIWKDVTREPCICSGRLQHFPRSGCCKTRTFELAPSASRAQGGGGHTRIAAIIMLPESRIHVTAIARTTAGINRAEDGGRMGCPASTIFADSCCLIEKCYRNFSAWGPSRPALIPALQRVPPWAHQPWRRPAFWP